MLHIKEYLRGQIDLLITIVPEVFKIITNTMVLLLKILKKNVDEQAQWATY
jgi:hypothetical protein